MGRLSFRAAVAAAMLPCLVVSTARGAEPIDNDELVAGAEFTGLPDKSSHSGVFLDIIAVGSASIVGAQHYRVLVGPDQPTLRVAIFDGNAGNHWDQNLIDHDAGGNVVPDGSVVEYTLMTDGPGGEAARVDVALADSETGTPRADAVQFLNAVDGRWQFLHDGAHHAAALLPTGERQYLLRVVYRPGAPAGAINGFKIAANGFIGQARATTLAQTVLGGFIGGVVDSRNLTFTTTPNFSVSRDHYPDVLEPSPTLNTTVSEPAARHPAVRYPAPDPFVNSYTGTFDVRLRLVPDAGDSFGDFVSTLILEEGDADDFDDLSGLAPDGSTSSIDPGIPPDDGRPYVLPSGSLRDSSGYRLPVSLVPSAAGSPWLQLIDPLGAVRVTLTDLSGNIPDTDATGNSFEKIPVPVDGVPGTWIVRMHNLDARNSWFLRTNAEIASSASLEGRVYFDVNCDRDDELDADPGLAGLTVKIHRTDATVPDVFRTTDADGAWSVAPIAPGTYEVSVVDSVFGMTTAVVQPITRTIAADQSVRDADIGYCDASCGCGTSGTMVEVCLEATVPLEDPDATEFDVAVTAERGCTDGALLDTAQASWSGDFPGVVSGANHRVRIEDVKIADGNAIVILCLHSDLASFPEGYLAGDVRFEVTVNGTTVEACGALDCHTLSLRGPFPAGTEDPDFRVQSWTPTECSGDETAFAKGGWVLASDPKANPEKLPSLKITDSRWGWAIQLKKAGKTTYDLWAGAGLNDTTKGVKVGTVTVDWASSGALTVKYVLTGGATMTEAHVYADDAKPTTAAPGQFGYTRSFFPGVTQFTANLGVVKGSGGIWVMAHAVVNPGS